MKTKLYLTLIFMIMSYLGHAQPGEIDNSFNSSGIGAYGTDAVSAPPTAAQADAQCIVYKSKVYTTPTSVHKDKVVIIGRFRSFNGVARKYVARLNADGTLDTSFNAPALSNGYLYCVYILPDDKILIGGDFTISVSGTTIKNLARLNADGSVDNTFNVGTGTRGPNALVHALAFDQASPLANSKILIGGTLTNYNGSTGTKRVMRLNYDGSIDATFNGIGSVNGEVRALAFQNIGGLKKIIVGGFFSGFSDGTTTTKNKILRLLPNGDLDTSFNPGGSGAGGGDIYDIFVKSANNRIYAVGNFTSYNGTTRKSLVFLESDGTMVPTGTPSFDYSAGSGVTSTGSASFIFTILVQPDSRILIGGSFSAYNGTTIPKGIARLNSNATLDNTFLTGTGPEAGFQGGTDVYQGISVIRDIQLQSDGKIIVGGDYLRYNGTTRRMVSRIKTRECILAAVYDQETGWSNGTGPTSDQYYMSIVSGSLVIPTGTHLTACELEIKPNASVTIQSGASLTVKGIVMNNGSFTVDNTGSLVQVKDDTKNADLGAGVFTMKRTTSPLQGYDFVFWSSPVEDQTLHNLSPFTRPDKYYKFDAVANNWIVCNNGTDIMEDGRGYIIRAPADYTMGTFQQFQGAFIGRARNGTTPIPIYKTAANGMNLVGNPYPSAIDAVKFLNDPANVSKIDGTILLWSHASAISAANPGPNQINYNSDDYIAFNKTGGLAAADATEPFAGKIAAGQAFFITSLVSTPVTPQPVATFNNTMRITGENNVFYKTATVSNDSRIWVNFYNAQGAFRQTLIGYMDGATDGIDRSFDGEAASANSYVNFYSIAANKNLSIQGRALPFNENQVIPMGYKTTIAGTFSIRVGKYDGLFNNQHVYIVDKLQNTTQEIKSGIYSFTTAAGTFNDRFEIKFVNNVLAISNPAAADSNTALVMAENSEVKIQSSETIESIAVYDITGKTLYNKKGIAASTFNTGNLNVSNQVILVTVTFENKSTLTKKVMVN